MAEKKMSWKRPKLIVLGRGRPEEKVLANCKNNQAKVGPGSSAQQCKNWPANCSINATS